MRDALLYKKRNGACKWNIRVVKVDGGRWVFIGTRWNLNAILSPRIRIDSRFLSFEFGNPSLVIDNFANGLYPRVYKRANRMKAFHLSLSLFLSLVSSRLVLRPISRNDISPASFPARFDSLRFITLVIVPSRELRGRVISRGYPSDWVAKRRFRAHFLARSPAN